LKVANAKLARATLGALPVTPAAPRVASGSLTLNAAISASGLEALGAPRHVLQRLPDEFRSGMAARSASLGDTGANSPDNWDHEWAGGVHVLLSVYGGSVELVDREAQRVAQLPGFVSAGIQPGTRLTEDREHFGFVDGFGQPDIEGVPRRPGQGQDVRYSPLRTGRAERRRFLGQAPIKAGELILGYKNLGGETPPVQRLNAADDDAGHLRYAQFVRDGTFMVYRVLSQDVAQFMCEMARLATETGVDGEIIAARMVGRWKDGTPLALAPTRDAWVAFKARGIPRAKLNDFHYGDDPDGLKCPAGAHIRRANPRDSLGFKGRTVDRHRIVRRGIPYGLPYSEDPGGDRGLVFIALNASIAGQFEVIQREWLDGGHVFGLGAAGDPLTGNRHGSASRTFAAPGESDPIVCTGLAQLVTLRGGEYFFVPGIHALAEIARWTDELAG
jgi:Dyp-type peroxidase family